MADTAYERFLKDPNKEEAVDIDIKEQKPIDLEQVKMKIQTELTGVSKPTKPVKWLAMPDPKTILETYYTFNPTKRLANVIAGMENVPEFLADKEASEAGDPMAQLNKLPDAKAKTFRIGNK